MKKTLEVFFGKFDNYTSRLADLVGTILTSSIELIIHLSPVLLILLVLYFIF